MQIEVTNSGSIEQNFFEIAKTYPFGITKLDMEKVVCGPIKVINTGELVCVGEIYSGSC